MTSTPYARGATYRNSGGAREHNPYGLALWRRFMWFLGWDAADNGRVE